MDPVTTPPPPGQQFSDADWCAALPHRDPRDLPALITRFERAGLTPHRVTYALRDLGDALTEIDPAIPEHTLGYGPPGATGHQGVEAVALLAAEIETYASHVARRAARMRANAFTVLIATSGESLSTIAARMGISKQALHASAAKRHPLAEGLTARLTAWRNP